MTGFGIRINSSLLEIHWGSPIKDIISGIKFFQAFNNLTTKLFPQDLNELAPRSRILLRVSKNALKWPSLVETNSEHMIKQKAEATWGSSGQRCDTVASEGHASDGARPSFCMPPSPSETPPSQIFKMRRRLPSLPRLGPTKLSMETNSWLLIRNFEVPSSQWSKTPCSITQMK